MVEIKNLYTGSKHTVVSFSSIGNTVQGVNAEFYNLKNNGYNVIWVIDKTNSYFNYSFISLFLGAAMIFLGKFTQ